MVKLEVERSIVRRTSAQSISSVLGFFRFTRHPPFLSTQHYITLFLFCKLTQSQTNGHSEFRTGLLKNIFEKGWCRHFIERIGRKDLGLEISFGQFWKTLKCGTSTDQYNF